mmetsp:Transcript_6357/g.12295  ORF Transcript_6357/g.12295 Transcript_6357/m.12295 type:complete len:221 (-) Transcript_6357:277-939(-)
MTSHHHFRLLPLILLAIIGSRACGTITSGTCTSHIDCTATIRSRSPDPSELCECYAASSTDPFDECKGKESGCATARCANTCDGLEALCLTLTDYGNDGANDVCTLREIIAPGSNMEAAPETTLTSAAMSTTDQIVVGHTCNDDGECTATVRSRFPTRNNAGIGMMCECYSASSVVPFDECQGEDDSTCRIAKCGNICDGMEGYCDENRVCALRGESASS